MTNLSTETEEDRKVVETLARSPEPHEEMLYDHLIGLTANAYTIMTLLENMEYAIPETRSTTLTRLAKGYITTANRINEHVQKFIATNNANSTSTVVLTDT